MKSFAKIVSDLVIITKSLSFFSLSARFFMFFNRLFSVTVFQTYSSFTLFACRHVEF